MRRGSGRLWVLLAILLATFAVRAGWEIWQRTGRPRIEAARAARVTPEIDVAPARVTGPTLIGPDGTDDAGYPRQYVDRPLLRTLLWREQYADLARRLEELHRAYQKDWHDEDWVWDALQALGVPELAIAPKLDAWVAAQGKSWVPHLVRGMYRVKLGYAQRGTAYAPETPTEDLRAMEDALEKGEEDLEHAVSLEPSLVFARRGQMQVAVALGNRERLRETYALATKICPLCFGPRVSYILGLRPRWGGSHEEMLRLARETRDLGNPRLRLLPGFVDIDRSRQLWEAKQMREAFVAADRACAAGDYWEFLVHRARVRLRTNAQLSLDDADRAAAVSPGTPEVHFVRADALAALKRYTEAGRELLGAIRADPVSADGRRLRPYVIQGLLYETGQHVKGGRRSEALAAVTLATELDPQNRELQGKRASLVSARSDSGQVSLAALKERAEASPDDLATLQEYDYALARQGRFQEVVDLWSGYLRRHPDDGRAYFERGGAYFQTGRVAEAGTDARRACELGLNEACTRARQLGR